MKNKSYKTEGSEKVTFENSNLGTKLIFHRFKTCVLATMEVNFLSWYYPNLRNREFSSLAEVEEINKSLNYEKSGKHCYISTYFHVRVAEIKDAES